MWPVARLPLFPRLGSRLLEPLPLTPLSLVLGPIVRGVARRHPRLFVRLGPHARKRYLIDPTDLPIAFLLRPLSSGPGLAAVGRDGRTGWDCRIAGPLAALLGLVHGTHDGDALFFSRDIVMEGDTEAVLALRNAIDDAELDLFVEAAASLGSLGSAAVAQARPIVAMISRLSGVAMTRIEVG